MYIDGLLQFSSAQALTTTAVSTNVVDLLNPRDMGIGEDPTLDVVAQVVTAFVGGTSIQAVLQGSVDNSTFTDMVSGPVVALANLIVGAQLANFAMPLLAPAQALPRYLRINYVIVGTMSAGAVTSMIVLDRQANRAYAPGIAIVN